MAQLGGVLNKSHLEEIVRLSPDDLAPSFGTVIRALVDPQASGTWPYYKPEVFFDNTELTEGFARVIRSTISILSSSGVSGLFLDLDMGSGKTHLLTLLLHLFASCRFNPDACAEYIKDYAKETGFDPRLAENTVVIAADMRTPESVYEYLKLTAMILKRAGAIDAANHIEESLGNRKIPDPVKLAQSIPLKNHILVLIDELHYSAILGTKSSRDRETVKEFLRFVSSLMSYRKEIQKEKRGGVAIVVASARRDFEKWSEMKAVFEDREFAGVLEAFVDQLKRVKWSTESRWVSNAEIQRIIARRLGLERPFNEVFHESFNRFIERAVKVDSDFPDAQHMRSLIKAFAIYALNALESNAPMVTPAHFSDAVITVLLGESDIARRYKAVYSEILDRLESAENATRRELLRLAVNILFTGSVVGNVEKMIVMIRAAKTGEALDEAIPLVKESELRDILTKVHGYSESDVVDALGALESIHPNIHGIKVAGGAHAYFVAPSQNVRAIYRDIIARKRQSYLDEKKDVVARLSEYVNELALSGPHVQQSVVGDLSDLDKVAHSKDKLYIYIYFNTPLLSISGDDKVLNKMLNDAEAFLKHKSMHNVVIVLPRVEESTIENIAHYLAVEDATSYIINAYLASIGKGSPASGSEEDELFRELLKVELKDIVAELVARINDALASFSKALASLPDMALYYMPSGGVMKADIRLIPAESRVSEIRELHKAVDDMRRKRADIIRNTATELYKWVSQGPITFVTESSAQQVLYDIINEDLKTRKRFQLCGSQVVFQVGERLYYIPPSIIEVAFSTAVEKLGKELGNKYAIESKTSGTCVEIVLEPKEAETATVRSVGAGPSAPSPRASVAPTAMEIIDSVAESGGGVVVVEIEVTEDNRELIKETLSQIMRYVRIRGAGS